VQPTQEELFVSGAIFKLNSSWLMKTIWITKSR